MFDLGSGSHAFAPATDLDTPADFILPGSPFQTLYRVVASGSIQIWRNSNDGWGDLKGTLATTVGPAGYWYEPAGQCQANMLMAFDSLGGSSAGATLWCLTSEFDVAVYGAGTGRVSWTPINTSPPTFCGRSVGIACYFLSGSHSLTISSITGSLVLLTGQAITLPNVGAYATTTVAVTPATALGQQVPGQVTSWVFRNDNGLVRPVCVGDLFSCQFEPGGAGMLEVTGFASGQPASTTFSVRVAINDCAPANDSTGVIENPDVRKRLREEMLLSRPASGPRAERGGYVYQLADGSGHVITVGPIISATECSISLGAPSGGPAGGIVVGMWHTHPLNRGDLIADCATHPIGNVVTSRPGGFNSGDYGQWQNASAAAPGPFASLVVFSNGDVLQIDKSYSNPKKPRRWRMDHGSPYLCAERK